MLTGTAQSLTAMGFDRTVYWEHGFRLINVGIKGNGSQVVRAQYRVDRVIAQNPSIIGPGTVCWGVKKVGEDVVRVIKDAWLDVNDGQEEPYLSIADQKDIAGVPKLLLIDLPSGAPREPRSMSALRLSQRITTHVKTDRSFTRSLFEDAGPSLSHFKTGRQVLRALKAAIESEFPIEVYHVPAERSSL